jgi:hypothetical protein
VQESEVGDIELVVNQLSGPVAASKRCEVDTHSVFLGKSRDFGELDKRLAQRHKDKPVALGDRIGTAATSFARHGGALCERRDRGTSTGTVVAPPVVRALEHAVDDLARRQWGEAVGAAVFEHDYLVGHPDKNERFPEQPSARRRAAHRVGAGDG